jgi:hypothetical protein
MYENSIKKRLRQKGRGDLNWINLSQYNFSIYLAERIKNREIFLHILIKLISVTRETFFLAYVILSFQESGHVIYLTKSVRYYLSTYLLTYFLTYSMEQSPS